MFNSMRRSIFLSAIFFAITLYSAVYGQQMKGKFALSGTGGLGFPVGDLADKEKGRAQTGYGMGGNLEHFVTDNLSLGVSFRYQKFGMYVRDLEEEFVKWVHESDPEADTSGVDIDAHKSIIQLGFFYKYHLFTWGNLSPYVKLGAGWGGLKGFSDQPGYVRYPTHTVRIKSKVDASYDGDFYVDAGGGALYLMSDRLGISGEILFTSLATDENSGTVITKTQVDGDYQKQEERKFLDYNCSYITVFLSLSFFF